MKCPLCGREYKEEELKYPLMRFYGVVRKVCINCRYDAFKISQRYLQVKERNGKNEA